MQLLINQVLTIYHSKYCGNAPVYCSVKIKIMYLKNIDKKLFNF